RSGLKMFDFGLRREASNGAFPGSFGRFHGTAMFLAEAGPALLILEYWPRKSSLGPATVKHIEWQASRLHEAARYLMRAFWSKPGHIDDGGKEDRFFEAAIAMASVGFLV